MSKILQSNSVSPVKENRASSPESPNTISSESWENVDEKEECEDDFHLNQEIHKPSPEYDVIDDENSIKHQILPDDEIPHLKSDTDVTPLDLSYRYDSIERERKDSEFQGKFHTAQHREISSAAAYDGNRTVLYPHSAKSQDDTSNTLSNILRPLKNRLNPRKSLNEKSLLVKNAMSVVDNLKPVGAQKYEKLNDIPMEDHTRDSCRSPIKLEDGKISDIPENTSKDAVKGLSLAFLGAGVMYGLTGVFVRLAGENGVGSVEVLFVRSLFQTILFGSILLCKRTGLRPPPGHTGRCVLIAILYCSATFASYVAFDIIPPGSAIATRGACRTIFSLLLTYFIAKERAHLLELLTLFLCVSGIAMIITSGMTSGDKNYILPPGMTDDPTTVRILGYSLIIIGGLTRSIGLVAVRGAKGEVGAFSVVFYHSSLTVLISLITLFAVSKPTWPPSPAGIGYTVALCIASSIATWSSNQAVIYVHPALVSLGQNADVLVSITLQHTILRMAPRLLELFGAGLVLVGVCGLTLTKWRQSRKEEQAERTLATN